MRRARIGVDMDQICVDFLTPLIGTVNAELGLAERVEDADTYRLQDRLDRLYGKTAGDAAEAILQRPGFYRGLPVLAGAQRVTRRWVECGHEVYVVTSPGRAFGCIPDKAAHLDEAFPHLDPRKRVFSSAKHLLDLDFLIDDSPYNAQAAMDEAAARGRRPPRIATVEWPYHAGAARGLFELVAPSWRDTSAAWEAIDDFVRTSIDAGY